jgi:hypothetical protein
MNTKCDILNIVKRSLMYLKIQMEYFDEELLYIKKYHDAETHHISNIVMRRIPVVGVKAMKVSLYF